jgi:eukaryotic-like serine/threonine-protein kinase
MAKESDRIGQVLGGRYKIIASLDKGGQGSIYVGLDQKAGDKVAIKVLSERMARSSEWRERMFREAQAMTQLAGTAAVRVYHQVWTDDGALALIMELLIGSELETWLYERETAGKKLSVPELVKLFDPIVETLEKAHDVGILHRDLKPANIFVLKDGSVRLLDFGLAKFTRMRGLTQAGFVAGSPSYIAPEGWLGEPQLLDQRIDVYALGAVIYRALAAEPLFPAGDAKESWRLATTAERPSLYAKRPDLGPGVDDWVKEALAIDPNRRFLRVRGLWNAFKSTVRTA